MSDIFDKPEFYKAWQSGSNYALPGTYPEIEVGDCKLIKSSKDGATCFVVEMIVKASNVPERPVGCQMSYVCKDNQHAFFSNMRTFISQLTGEAFEKITPETCRGVTSDAQPLKGSRVSLLATQVDTKKVVNGAPGKYTKHSYALLELSPTMKKLREMAATA